jgi:hypothetical protein
VLEILDSSSYEVLYKSPWGNPYTTRNASIKWQIYGGEKGGNFTCLSIVSHANTGTSRLDLKLIEIYATNAVNVQADARSFCKIGVYTR